MSEQLTESEMQELMCSFGDLINYEDSDPTAPIDPVTYKEPGGDQCIHIAAHRGDLRAVELLIKAGADVNAIGEMGSTPLHYASAHGHKKIVAYLLEHGASTNILDEFGNPPYR